MPMFSIFTIYNRVEDSYSPLDICANSTVAKRRFKTALSSDKVLYKKDFELYKVGEINPVTYEITASEKVKICEYADLENDSDVA